MPVLVQAAGITRPVRAVLFDKDGTLVDFFALWGHWAENLTQDVADRVAVSDQQTTARLVLDLRLALGVGAHAERQCVDAQGPLNLADPVELQALLKGVLYRRGLTWPAAAAIVDAVWAARAPDLHTPAYIRPVPGTQTVLQQLAAAGVALGLVTADTTELARVHLEHLGLRDLFGAVVGQDLVHRSKPAPDLALLACQRLQVHPEQTALVGDSAADMGMGRAAGIGLCIGVLTGVGNLQSLSGLAHVVLPTAADLQVHCA